MADERDDGDRTEDATPKRRQQARDDGQVALSQEVSVAMTMVLLTGLISWVFPTIATELTGLFRANLSLDSAVRGFSSTTAITAVRRLTVACLRVVGPVAFAAMALGLFVNIAQVGVHLNFGAISPKIENMDPSKWLKRIFSADLFVTLIKSLFKGLGIVAISLYALRNEPQQLFHLAYVPAPMFGVALEGVAMNVVVRVAAALAVVAGIDVLWTRYRFEERIKMSKDEVKQEMKEVEGNPQVKAAQRQRMMQSRNRPSLEEQVKSATVISVNPTHYAVALRYWKGQDAAPVVLAKGMDVKAQRIREIAKRFGIPVIENKPLTRALYKAAVEGQSIPLDLFEAVAKLLALVYQMRANSDGGRQ